MKRFLAIFLSVTFLAMPLAAMEPFFDSGSDPRSQPFEFTDQYYFQNGVNPNLAVNRRTGTDGLSVFDTPPDPIFRNIRVKITLPAYDHSGNFFYWYLLGEIFENGFTPDAAGARAREIANRNRIFVFPSRSGGPVQLGNNRQADIVDLRNGYFSNDPLGLWIIVFVNYTPLAETKAGREILRRFAERNGLSLDGTPIIRNLSDLDDLTRQGLVTQRTRVPNGSEGPRYSLCPVLKDPRDGAIRPDAFLATVRQPNGEPLPAERAFLDHFNCLQNTGDWCDD
jgi:hypothetical protein